jgi:hypothetical protein
LLLQRRRLVLIGASAIASALLVYAASDLTGAPPAQSPSTPAAAAPATPVAPPLERRAPLPPPAAPPPRGAAARPPPQRETVDLALIEVRDDDPAVRAHSVLVLGRAKTPEAAAALLETVRDPDPNVSTMSAMQLDEAYQAGLVSFEQMHTLATDLNLGPGAHFAAFAGLAKVADPRAAEFLLERLKNGTGEERRTAAGMLQHQGAAIAVPALIEALGDGEQWVRYNANEQLRALARGRDYGEDAAAWSRWWAQEQARLR